MLNLEVDATHDVSNQKVAVAEIPAVSHLRQAVRVAGGAGYLDATRKDNLERMGTSPP